MRRAPRTIALGALALVLAAGAGLARARLDQSQPQHVQAALLYLPEGPYLRALALGHEETLADLLYIWSIQYYSNYSDKARYAYVKQVFGGAITELDPRYTEAYLVGALIMSIEARNSPLALELYDKGLDAMPENWEIAYWAGWECYSLKRYDCSRAYWERAAAMPGAPVQLVRLAARMIERSGDLRAALEEYERILATTKDEATRRVVSAWAENTRTQIVLAELRDALARYRRAKGMCPAQLSDLARAGLVPALPPEEELPFRYDRASCEVLPAPGQSFGRPR
ncbi:MAG: hypothetical protein KBD01_05660 [Acidobacteria bacterium]|nr:hypothetical protein [Acidobacteriota bacterium]